MEQSINQSTKPSVTTQRQNLLKLLLYRQDILSVMAN